MARLRKVSRLWRDENVLKCAARALVSHDGPLCTVRPEAIFGRPAQLEIEIGAGKGDFIIPWAVAHPERNFLAVELSPTIAQLLAARCGWAGLPNLRVSRMDGRTLVNLMLTDHSVSAYHIYFPDPWPKRRHLKHRLFSDFFVHSLARTLLPDGALHVATDVAERADEIFSALDAAGFRRLGAQPPGMLASGFGRKYQARGKNLLALSFAPPPAQPGASLPSPILRLGDVTLNVTTC